MVIVMETVLIRLLLVALLLYLSTPVWGQKRKGYRKATEGQAVVLRKLFPKKKRIEVNANFGAIMNQSFVDTVMMHGGVSYHFSEEWGLAFEGAFAMNQDRAERSCIETFYNDFRGKNAKPRLAQKCLEPPLGDEGKELRESHGKKLNIGPAYMAITEVGTLFAISAVWSPVYGKQIFSFLPRTSHMDIFLTFGGGVGMSTYYPVQEKLKGSGKTSRYTTGESSQSDRDMQKIGASKNERDKWGEAGRPTPEERTDVFVSLSVGQKYHFLKHIFIKVELRNYTLLATPDGYHNFFTMWGGLGLRI